MVVAEFAAVTMLWRMSPRSWVAAPLDLMRSPAAVVLLAVVVRRRVGSARGAVLVEVFRTLAAGCMLS